MAGEEISIVCGENNEISWQYIIEMAYQLKYQP
jgi:hypothetical protein